jgi:hypothetical protein
MKFVQLDLLPGTDFSTVNSKTQIICGALNYSHESYN